MRDQPALAILLDRLDRLLQDRGELLGREKLLELAAGGAHSGPPDEASSLQSHSAIGFARRAQLLEQSEARHRSASAKDAARRAAAMATGSCVFMNSRCFFAT